MFGRVLPAALSGGMIVFSLAGHLAAATRTVDRPMFNGNRLDWCANWGEDCGQPAADAWCTAQGFAGAVDFARDPHIGSRSHTRLIGTGAVCDASHCDGFKTITCAKIEPLQPQQGASAHVMPAVVSIMPHERPVPAATPTAVVPQPVPRPPDAIAAPVVAAAPPEKLTPPAAAAADPTSLPAEGGKARVKDDDRTILVAAVVAPPKTETFDQPVFNGRRLDWCRGWKDACGKAAADDFCKLNGYAEAVAFSPDPHIGDTQPTRQIASGLVCDHDGCDGFAAITCRE